MSRHPAFILCIGSLAALGVGKSSKDDLDVQHQRYMDRVLQPESWTYLPTDNVLVTPFIDRAIRDHRNATHVIP